MANFEFMWGAKKERKKKKKEEKRKEKKKKKKRKKKNLAMIIRRFSMPFTVVFGDLFMRRRDI